ncbi:hypothetical protein Tco_0996934 [Tanacetum coccineum]
MTFPPGNDDLPFDADSDFLELEYMLNHDPIKDMDSSLEDSVDKNSLDDNLDDTISEMFIDGTRSLIIIPPSGMMTQIFKDSRARVLRSQELHNPQLHLGIPIS